MYPFVLSVWYSVIFFKSKSVNAQQYDPSSTIYTCLFMCMCNKEKAYVKMGHFNTNLLSPLDLFILLSSSFQLERLLYGNGGRVWLNNYMVSCKYIIQSNRKLNSVTLLIHFKNTNLSI